MAVTLMNVVPEVAFIRIFRGVILLNRLVVQMHQPDGTMADNGLSKHVK